MAEKDDALTATGMGDSNRSIWNLTPRILQNAQKEMLGKRKSLKQTSSQPKMIAKQPINFDFEQKKVTKNTKKKGVVKM